MSDVTARRPAHVPAKFAGRCKVYPVRDALLLGYQERWVRDESRLKLMEKARQIGISWATAYALVRRKARKGAALDAWVSSRDETQARLFLEDSKAFAGILHAGATDLGERVIDEQGNSAFVLSLANGLRIHSMSSNPDAQAGKRGDRVLDEFALHPDPRKLYTIAYPGITWGGQLEVVSTHRGSANYFNELVREIRERGNRKAFSLHRVTIQDALDQGFLYKLQSKLPPDDPRQEMDEAQYFDFIRSGCADEESFLQEYMCVAADDAGAFLSYDQIAACEYRADESWELGLDGLAACRNPLHVGVDIGRTHDLTVIWVLEKAAGRGMTRRVVELRNSAFESQEAELYPILALPNVRRCCIDNTGIGRQFAERAQRKFGTYKVEAVNFTGPVKEQLAYPLKAAFEDLNLRIPCSKDVRADLRAIRKETTAAGNIRITADRGKGGHSDRFWALALAWHAGAAGDLGPCKAEPASASADGPAPHSRPDNAEADDPLRRPAWSY